MVLGSRLAVRAVEESRGKRRSCEGVLIACRRPGWWCGSSQTYSRRGDWMDKTVAVAEKDAGWSWPTHLGYVYRSWQIFSGGATREQPRETLTCMHARLTSSRDEVLGVREFRKQGSRKEGSARLHRHPSHLVHYSMYCSVPTPISNQSWTCKSQHCV